MAGHGDVGKLDRGAGVVTSIYDAVAKRALTQITRKGSAGSLAGGAPPTYDGTLPTRFWAKVNKDGPVHPVLGTPCWLWTASFGTAGYGQIGVGGAVGRPIGAHRVSWELHNGPIPDGMCALHKCDVKACVNPEHLFTGTLIDNVADMMEKGRHVAPRSLQTHCKRGHPFDGVWSSGERYCRACHRAKTRAGRERARQRVAKANQAVTV